MGYILSLILRPLLRGSEWFFWFFVTKNNSPGVSQGSTNREENDKCISVNKLTNNLTTVVITRDLKRVFDVCCCFLTGICVFFFWLTTYYRHGHNLVLLTFTIKPQIV